MSYLVLTFVWTSSVKSTIVFKLAMTDLVATGALETTTLVNILS